MLTSVVASTTRRNQIINVSVPEADDDCRCASDCLTRSWFRLRRQDVKLSKEILVLRCFVLVLRHTRWFVYSKVVALQLKTCVVEGILYADIESRRSSKDLGFTSKGGL